MLKLQRRNTVSLESGAQIVEHKALGLNMTMTKYTASRGGYAARPLVTQAIGLK